MLLIIIIIIINFGCFYQSYQSLHFCHFDLSCCLIIFTARDQGHVLHGEHCQRVTFSRSLCTYSVVTEIRMEIICKINVYWLCWRKRNASQWYYFTFYYDCKYASSGSFYKCLLKSITTFHINSYPISLSLLCLLLFLPLLFHLLLLSQSPSSLHRLLTHLLFSQLVWQKNCSIKMLVESQVCIKLK